MAKKQSYRVAVVGATGMVGEQMRLILEERNFPVSELVLLASERSQGQTLPFHGRDLPVRVLTPDSFAGVDIALLSAGASVSKEFVPAAVRAGAVCIDNTSYFRMDPAVPLVVPEVNPQDLKRHRGIIANPNCSTIQMVVVLKPIHDAAVLRRVVVSTYQSVSGAGRRALNEMLSQSREILDQEPVRREIFPRQIAFNLIPQIDVFLADGYTKEEAKMINETRKILGLDNLRVTATCVRVPVRLAHSETVNVETERKLTVAEVRTILAQAPGIRVIDDPAQGIYPTPLDAAGGDETLVGRIREDLSAENGIHLWVVADNIRKGAALNAVQIAERMMADNLI